MASLSCILPSERRRARRGDGAHLLGDGHETVCHRALADAMARLECPRQPRRTATGPEQRPRRVARVAGIDQSFRRRHQAGVVLASATRAIFSGSRRVNSAKAYEGTSMNEGK